MVNGERKEHQVKYVCMYALSRDTAVYTRYVRTRHHLYAGALTQAAESRVDEAHILVVEFS